MTRPKLLGRRLFALVLIAATVSGCSESGAFSFASRSAELGRSLPRGLTEIRMGEDPVIISGPDGFCFDQQTLNNSPEGGFALLARCENLRPLTRYRLSLRNKDDDFAIISATISAAHKGAQTPDIKDLISASAPVQVFSEHPDELMSMIRMEAATPGIPGSSTTQWRGVMSLGDRLIVLTLFAPDGSALLGPPGAQLLRQMARRSDLRSKDALPLNNTSLAPPTPEPATQDPEIEGRTSTTAPGPLRPRLRPGTSGALTVAQAPRPKRRSRRARVANLFN